MRQWLRRSCRAARGPFQWLSPPSYPLTDCRPQARPPRFSLISNYILYNGADIRLNIGKVGSLTNTKPREEVHDISFRWIYLRRRCRRPDRRGDGYVRAGQDVRAQAVTLGAGVASVAEGAGGLGRRGGEGLRRHHQIQGLSVAAARQGLR